MKRFLSGFLILGLLFSVSFAEAAFSPTQTTGSNWWSQYFSNSSARTSTEANVNVTSSYQPVNYRSFLTRYNSVLRSSSRNNSTASVSTSTPSTRTYYTPRTTSIRYYDRSRTNSSSPSFYTSYRSSRGASSYSARGGATVTVNTIRPSQAVTQMLDQPIPVFDIGVSNNSSSGGSSLPEVYLLRGMEFEIIDREGIFVDFSDFVLSINGTDQRFSDNGTIAVRFTGDNRITRGNSLNLDVKLKLDDVDVYPRISGGLRLRLVNTQVISESTGSSIQTSLVGRSTSEFLSWNPTPGVSTGGTSTLSAVSSKPIYGRTLGAGEAWDVLSVDLQAIDDDLVIEELTVRDILSGGDIDGWSDKLEVIDAGTGRVLDSAYFTGGKASFQFNPGLTIYRNQNRVLYFRIYIRSRVNTSSQNTSFKLDISPSDIEVYGIGAGKNLSTANKQVNTNTDTFFVSSGGGTGGVSNGPQPQLVPTGNPTPAYRFTVQNAGSRHISLGRVTTAIYANGIDFAGGSLTPDDIQISEYSGGEQLLNANVSIPSGNIARIDFANERTISPRSSRTFTVWVATENPQPSVASLSFQILGDSSLQKGTLSSVKGSGANFVWSDHSGSPHSESSSDWLSGYLFGGLPTSNQLNKY